MNVWRVVAIVVFLVVSAAFAFAGSLTTIAMVNAVNLQLPPESRFQLHGRYWNKSARLRDAYRRLYPDGTLARKRDMITMGVLVCWAAAGFALFGL